MTEPVSAHKRQPEQSLTNWNTCGDRELEGQGMAAENGVKSRILIIGATGNLGHQLAAAALRSSHPTFALVRPSALSDPVKSRILGTLSDAGLVIFKVARLFFPIFGP